MTGVVIAVSAHGEDAIAAAIAAHPELTLVRRCADLAEALAAASAGVAGVVVVSPQRHLDRVTLGEFAHMRVRVVGDFPYLIFYRVVGPAVVSIVHIRHAARRPFAR